MRNKIEKIVIYYDGECPFCDNYIKLVNLKKSFTNVSLVDVRSEPQKVKEFRNKNIEINDGMVVVLDNYTHLHGHKAMEFLALNSTGNILLKILHLPFIFGRLSRFFYSILKFGRLITLKILNRKLID